MKNNILKNKIKAYSALASCILGAADMAHGQVIYTDVNPDIIIHGDEDFALDLNNDGITDFYFVIEEESYWSNGYVNIATAYVNNNSVVTTSDFFPAVFEYGDSIKPGLNWHHASDAVLGHAFKFWQGAYYSSFSSGNWLSTYEKFLPLRFKINNENHYGWLKLSVTGWANNITIHNYAYETQPDTPISAGFVGCPVYYLDADNDYHGASDDPGTVLCENPGAGYSISNDDCDDSNPEIVPRSPLIEWGKSFGGTKSDVAVSIQQTNDGGFIVAGYTLSNDGNVSGNHGNYDYWIVKLDDLGNIEWQKCLGGSSYDLATSIQQTDDSGFIVAGYTRSNDGDVSGNHGLDDYWIVKLDSIGDLEWQKCLGGSSYDYATSIQQTDDSGFIVAGYTFSNNGDVSGNHGSADYWIIKLNPSGSIEWKNCFGGWAYDYAYSTQQTTDGGFIVGGASSSDDGNVSGNHGYYDYWIVKLSNNGSLQWQKCLGGSDEEKAYSIQQTLDEGFIVSGNSVSNDQDVSGNHGDGDIWVVKLDETGNIEWQKSLGGSSYEYSNSVCQSSEGGFIIAGTTYSTDGDITGNPEESAYWIVKLSGNGNIEGENTFGGTFNEGAYSAQQTSDLGIIVAGYSESHDQDVGGNAGSNDFWIVKFNLPPGGIEVCNNVDDNCNGTVDDGLFFSFYFIDNDNDTYGNPDNSIFSCLFPSDYVLDSTDCDDSNANIFPGAQEILFNGIDDNCNGYIDEFGTGIEELNSTSFFTIFPNPANTQTAIQFTIPRSSQVNISICDLSGKKIKTLIDSELQQGDHSLQINTAQLSKGIYLVRMISNEGMQNQKLIIQ